MDRKEFCKLARVSGLIGAPCASFEDSLNVVLDPKITVEFAGPINDIVHRCYWSDENNNGGCISIPV